MPPALTSCLSQSCCQVNSGKKALKSAVSANNRTKQRLWRSGWDSNPRTGFSRQTISSRSRYDHFDTAPYINFDFRPSIFGETFRRETVPSAPPTNPGSIDFTGFFDCELPFEAGDFEFHANKPNSKWVTGISYIHTKQGVLYLSISTTTASLPTRPEHSRR